MRLSLIQITVGPQIEKNFEKVDKFINQALSFKPNLILLPECFLFLSNFKKFSFSMDHEYILHYQNFAKKNEINLLLGSLPILYKDKIYNRSILINHEGSIASYYDKIHMFDVNINNKEKHKESESFKPGKKIMLTKIRNIKLGLTICYDLRFPNLFRDLSKKGAEVILMPAAFTVPTGRDHWEVLVRARAIENGAFVVATNMCGTHHTKRKTYGHSILVNPWGKVVNKAFKKQAILNSKINLDEVKNFRNRIPSLYNG